MPQAIHTDQLSKHFGRVIALDRVNLDVQEGALYALVGQNGAGKTTTIKVLMNLIRATGGSAIVLGTDSHNIRGKSYTQIGYVSENQEMPEWMKTGALLKYLREFYSTWDSDLEQSLVKQFDLPLDRKIKTLSRGMKMKLALASALAFHPRLIVLDEPFGGLDPLVRDQLIESLLERAAESTVSISSRYLLGYGPQTRRGLTHEQNPPHLQKRHSPPLARNSHLPGPSGPLHPPGTSSLAELIGHVFLLSIQLSPLR